MLSATKFPVTEEQKFPNVKVKIDHRKNEIIFKGDRADIMHTKLNMFETLSKFSIRTLNIPESHAELFRANQVQEYVKAKLETKNLICAWEVVDSELVICSSEADVVSCVTVVSESVKEETIQASSDSVCALYTCQDGQWPARLTHLHKGKWFIFKVHSCENSKMIHLISTDNVSSEVVKLIKAFLKGKVNIQADIICDRSPAVSCVFQALKFCPNAIRKWLEDIEKDLSMHYVSIKLDTNLKPYCIDLAGTKEGIALAKTRLSNALI